MTRIDLHTHSLASDGTQSPAELVHAAVAAGLDVVAITDHDTTAGWAEAGAAATEAGIELVRGLELSTRHAGRGVHLLVYEPDPGDPDLVALLERILAGRSARLPAIVANLRRAGVELDEDDVRRVAGASVPGRPHVADALVARGAAADRSDAFARWLDPGRPGFARRWAAELEEALGVVRAAGGVPVLAHPWGRGGRGRLDEEAFAALAEQGVAGLEVDHQDHDEAARADLRAIATNLGLAVTGGSDHHGTGKVDHELGCNTTAPEAYARLLAARSPR